MSLEIEFTEGDWFSVLSDGNSAWIASLMERGKDEEAIASDWVATIGAPRTATYGSERNNSSNLYKNIRLEFFRFICGSSDKYDNDRRKAEEIWQKQGKPGLVLSVAAILAGTVHIAAAAITPIVALLCSLVAKIGKAAFCATYAQELPLDPPPSIQ